MKPVFLALFTFSLILSGCAGPREIPLPTPTTDNSQPARQVLTGFFEALNRADYAAADKLYGGSYETLTTMNPDVPASDHVTLWKQGCQFNGLQCLKVKEVVASDQVYENTFLFVVHFTNADGTLFAQGPCCGEDQTGVSPVSEFQYEVRLNQQGRFQVMDMPPYVP